jgi:hypothetical protein
MSLANGRGEIHQHSGGNGIHVRFDDRTVVPTTGEVAYETVFNPKKAPDLKPENIVCGESDQAGRTIVDVYWITKEYAVYRWRKCTDEKVF